MAGGYRSICRVCGMYRDHDSTAPYVKVMIGGALTSLCPRCYDEWMKAPAMIAAKKQLSLGKFLEQWLPSKFDDNDRVGQLLREMQERFGLSREEFVRVIVRIYWGSSDYHFILRYNRSRDIINLSRPAYERALEVLAVELVFTM